MPPRPPPSRIAAALDYLQRLKSGVGEFVGGVGTNLADRARSVGGLAYEALTTDPNIGRMTTAEFSQAAADRAPTPRLDQAARDIGTIGRAIATQPVETGKAIVGGEIDRFKGAFASPQAAGEYAGSFLDPMRLAAALRHRVPISNLDVYHGTPHKYAPTEANPLGEFDASKIGTGEGAQAYGHGIYLAESPGVAKSYLPKQRYDVDADGSVSYMMTPPGTYNPTVEARDALDQAVNAREALLASRDAPDFEQRWQQATESINAAERAYDEASKQHWGSLYKADLPDEMIDRMLDWDKPLSEQPSAVREAFRNIMQSPLWDADTKKLLSKTDPNTLKGSKLYELLASSDELAGKGEFGKAASEELARLGIPGIRYLDAGSRGQGGSGTRNFVVFPGEEKKVKILERNGQPAPERIAQALEAAKPIETSVEIPEALHGSPFRGLEELLPSKAMEVRGTTWFSDNPEIADQYTFPREYGEILYDAEPGEIYKASLSFKNPLTVDFSGKVGDARELSKLVEQAKKQGYDGLIIRNVDDSIDSSKVLGTSYAVFDRNQIKLKK